MIDHDSLGQARQAAAIAANPGRGSGQDPDARLRRQRAGSPIALRNWRVRWRLLALIAIPAVTALLLGGARVASAVSSAQTLQRVERLAVLGGDVTQLTRALEDERDVTAGFIASGRPTAGVATMRTRYAATDTWAARVRALAAGVGHAYPAYSRAPLAAALARLNGLAGLRGAALHTRTPLLPEMTGYSQAIADLFAFDDNIALSSADATLTDGVRALGSLSRIKDEASQQRGILSAALIERRFGPGELAALTAAQAQQNSELSTYLASIPAADRQFYSDTVSGPGVDQARSLELRAVALGDSGAPLAVAVAASGGSPSQQWYKAMSDTIGRMRAVESKAAGAITVRSRALRQDATRSAAVTGLVVLCVLIMAVIVTVVIVRSMTRPLRRLRAGALDVAGSRLPETVRLLSETGGGEGIDVEPIDVASTDEVGEVARAFDQVHREALRLAANEALLRGNVNAMFVSLSRRSQVLVERQIRLIDELEQGEQDAERLANLFRMDHLATRMRRNSENLLVLAGHETARRWGKPVTLVDVLRAAVSEIEQYERVTLNVQPGTSVAGNAVNDVVHLLAELLENATWFSPGDTPVKVAGHLLNSGGVLLDITDHGVGMGAEDMAHANWRLENPPMVDVAVSRRMGLFVVARLAARHGIRVRLRQPEVGGLTALIWVPDALISHDATAPATWPRDLGAAASGQEPYPAESRDAPSAAPVLNAPVLPVNEWPAPARAAGTGPMPAAGTRLPKRAAGTAKARAADAGAGRAAGTGPMRVTGTGPMRAAGTGPARVTDTGPMPATGARSARAGDTGPLPTRGDGPGTAAGTGPNRVTGTGPMRAAGAGQVRHAQPAREIRPVIVPAGAEAGHEARLPIFDSLESDWFHRRGRMPQRDGQPPTGDEAGLADAGPWTSVGDEGWRAANGAAVPSVGPMTPAGLPRRVPQANIVPGSAGARVLPSVSPILTAEHARDRMASFQRGVRRARAVIKTENPSNG